LIDGFVSTWSLAIRMPEPGLLLTGTPGLWRTKFETRPQWGATA
jgi:hypothetical protein